MSADTSGGRPSIGRSRRRRATAVSAGKLLIALTVSLLALLAGEGLVRVLGVAPAVKRIDTTGSGSSYQRSTNPVLSFELKPGHRDAEPDLFQSYEQINSHGQRDVERSRTKPPGVKRILLLGDSVVEGSGIRADETISRRLEALYPEGDTEVLNFGVSGYCTAAEIELLATKGIAFDPDWAILLFVANDFMNFNQEAFRLEGRTERPEAIRRLFATSYAFRIAALRFNLWEYAAEQDPMRFSDRAVGDNNVVDGLSRFRLLALEHGFSPLVAIWPRFENGGIVDRPTLPDHPNELVVERIAAGFGLPTVRLSPGFRRDLARMGQGNPRVRYTIGDRMHPNAEGARVAAEALAEALAQAHSAPTGLADARGPDAESREWARALGEGFEPNEAKVYLRLGNLAWENGRLDEAVASFRKALEEDERSIDARVSLAGALVEAGEEDEALEHYRAAVRIDPDRSGPHNALGAIAERRGELQAAEAHFRKAVAAQPDHPDAIGDLARVLQKSSHPAEARLLYERALTLQPDRADLLNNLGRVLESQGDLEAAAERYRAALAVAPHENAARANLAIVRAQQGRHVEAVELFTEAARRDAGDAPVRRNLGQMLIGLEQWSEAVAVLREAVALEPSHLDTRSLLADVLEKSGLRAEAIVELEEALRLARAGARPDRARRLEARLSRLRVPE